MQSFCFLGLPPEPGTSAKQIFWVDTKESEPTPFQFFHLQTRLQERLFAREIAWKSVMQPLKIVAAPGWEEMAQTIEECHLAAHLLLSEVADFGLQAFANARANWAQGDFFLLESLKGSFQGMPAIVCGAGPSLEEAAPLLKQFEHRALIIAAGSAMTVLANRGIAFHLACAIDKEAPSYQLPEVPCCMQSRLRPDWVKELKGDKILAPESGPIPWENWWLGTEPIAFGWTVGNFATQVALTLGCSKIIWVGMDLCYQDGKKYADGAQTQTPLIDARGKKTQRDWLMAARFFEELARKHPEISFIQTAEKGLPLETPIQTQLFFQISLPQEIFASRLLKEALSRSSKHAADVSQKTELWQKSRQRCLALTDLAGEPVYDFFLEPLWRIWRPLFEREMLEGQTIETHRQLFFQQVLNAL